MRGGGGGGTKTLKILQEIRKKGQTACQVNAVREPSDELRVRQRRRWI